LNDLPSDAKGLAMTDGDATPAEKKLGYKASFLTVFMLVAVAFVLGFFLLGDSVGWSIRQAAAQGTDEPDDEVGPTSGVTLPTDRLRERQFDQANRLIDAKRFADATTLLDEMLAADEDVFLDEGFTGGQTSRSMKTRVTELIGSLPPAGKEAYLLQFRSRAERALNEGIAANNTAQIVTVARRWFHTPAGSRAAIVIATTLVEAGQPLAAAAWLDRLSSDHLANLPGTVRAAVDMIRTAAHLATAGNATGADRGGANLPAEVRLGGEQLRMGGGLDRRLLAQRLTAAVRGENGPPQEDSLNWQVDRGGPNRNPVCRCDRPLLVPRYRVPLTLHPEESRLVETRRQLLRDQGLPILPAGGPLAVNGLIVSQSRAGLVAVDFKSGKRVWMQSRLAESALVDGDSRQGQEELPHPLDELFTDATAATLASDGRLVFAVESAPHIGQSGVARNRLRQFNRPTPKLAASNHLVAYDIASGQQRWRLPSAGDQPAGCWYLGSPLPIGGRLYVLVESRQQIRLDVLAAESGETLWSQPLADVDIDHDIENRGDRRQAGLSPTFAGGILICPTGAGAVIAVDLAARTLRWAYRFAVPKPADVRRLANGIQLKMRVVAGGLAGVRIRTDSDGNQPLSRWLDTLPTVTGDRVLLTPFASDTLHCVNLRTGESIWERPRNDHLLVAGIVDRSVILVGQQQVTAISLDDGQERWEQPTRFADQQVCGRPLITDTRLFVPLTTPAVAEIDLADGKLIGTSLGRGESLPGNLVAHRGEIISQGVDSLDVFHQTVPLKRAVETAIAANSEDPWAVGWRGELRLAAGETATGLNDIRQAHGADGLRPAPAVVSRAIRFALRHDFAAASSRWQEGAATAESPEDAADILRQAIAGFLAAGDAASGWQVCQQLLTLPAVDPRDDAGSQLIADPQDEHLMLSANRWLQRQLKRLVATGAAAEPSDNRTSGVPAQITATVEAAVEAAAAIDSLPQRITTAELVLERFGDHPSVTPARSLLAAAMQQQVAAAVGMARQNLQLELELLVLRQGEPLDRLAPTTPATAVAAAWPVGEVTVTDDPQPENAEIIRNRLAIPLIHTASSSFPEASLETDGSNLLLKDRFGRPIGGGIPLTGDPANSAWRQQISRITRSQVSQATLIGRILLLTTTDELVVFEISDSDAVEHRMLWIMRNPYADSVNTQQIVQGESAQDRLVRQLGVRPLGMQHGQPHHRQVQRTPFFRTGLPRLTGVPIIYDHTLELRDLQTGRLLWQRRQLPDRAEAFGDDVVVCVAGPDGKDSLLLSTADGHLLAKHDLPPQDERLAVAGRRLLILEAGEESPDSDEVGLTSLDALNLSRTEAGSCKSNARGYADPSGVFFTVSTAGQLTAIDVAAGRTIFVSELPEPPAGLTEVRVLPWEDRYLILVGRTETAEERDRFDGIRAVNRFGVNRFGNIVETSLLYAVDRLAGDMLWPRPASIQRHILHVGQPAGLPVLVFARQLQMNRNARQVPDQPRHSLLCLDKRTGGLLHLDDRILIEPRHAAATAELRITGEPATGKVRLQIESRQRGGAGGREIVLQFTGLPAERAQPFRAEEKPLVYTDVLSELKYWIERALLFPN
jgi:outer membrane protein assembly factor BamB